MECEGEKLYFKQGRCPVCNMFLVPIEEREDQRNKPQTYSKTNLQKVSKIKLASIFAQCFAKATKPTNQIPVAQFVTCIWRKSLMIWSEVRSRKLEVHTDIKTPNAKHQTPIRKENTIVQCFAKATRFTIPMSVVRFAEWIW
ncbi:hypothetical protein D3C86_1789800 [compost metagenome]